MLSLVRSFYNSILDNKGEVIMEVIYDEKLIFRSTLIGLLIFGGLFIFVFTTLINTLIGMYME